MALEGAAVPPTQGRSEAPGVTAAASVDPFSGEVFWTDGNWACVRSDGADTALAPPPGTQLVDVNLDPPFPNAPGFRAVSLLADEAFTARFRPRVVDGTDYFGGLAEHDQWAVAQAEGRVLDVGAGTGRGALAVQARSQEVTALDTSAGAIETCRRRGVGSVYEGTVRQAAADGLGGTFDSALLLGNNLGLLGSRENAGAFLSDLGRPLKPGGVIVGTILDPYQTCNPVHLAYHQRNRDLGRMSGQLTMRVRYENMASAWFDWLAASPAETAELAAAAGWEVASSFPGISYAAALRRA